MLPVGIPAINITPALSNKHDEKKGTIRVQENATEFLSYN
jgi:hypothetical protein